MSRDGDGLEVRDECGAAWNMGVGDSSPPGRRLVVDGEEITTPLVASAPPAEQVGTDGERFDSDADVGGDHDYPSRTACGVGHTCGSGTGEDRAGQLGSLNPSSVYIAERYRCAA